MEVYNLVKENHIRVSCKDEMSLFYLLIILFDEMTPVVESITRLIENHGEYIGVIKKNRKEQGSGVTKKKLIVINSVAKINTF